MFNNLNRLNDAKPEERLSFSLMSFVGSGYFTISLSDGSNQRIPHVENEFDFVSRGTYLEISKADIE